MTKLLLISFVFLFMLFHSCEKDIYDRLDRKEWFVFNLNDTISYINRNKTKVDSFQIITMSHGFETTDKTLHQEYFGIGFYRINKQNNTDSIFNDVFNHTINRYYFGSHIRWRNLYCGTDYFDTYDTTFNLYSKYCLKHVSVLHYQEKTTIPNDIIRLYYCVNYGIVKYVYKNGDVFTIDSVLLSKYYKN